MPRALLWVSLVVGLIGLAASVTVHAMALLAVPLPLVVFALHLGVFVAFGPVVLALIKSAPSGRVGVQNVRQQVALYRKVAASIPVGQQVALGVAFAYFLGLFAYTVAGPFLGRTETDAAPLVFFSAGWIAAYLGSAVLARRLLASPASLAESPRRA